jgi:nucleoside-diphosphate-sugar epimerase
MRAFVTGATGFLGTRLVRRLLDGGAEVRALVRPGKAGSFRDALGPVGAGRLELLEGVLARVESYAGAVAGCDVVYHVAAALGGGPAVLFQNNVIATRALIGAASDGRVGRFVLVSSLGVYGTGHLRKWDVLDEGCPLDPQPHRRDPYTYSKVTQEQVAWEAHRAGRLPLVVVRPGVIYGPTRDCLTGRVGLQLGGLLVRMGGRQRLPYTYVDNCARAVELAGTVPGVEGEAFNVVDDDAPTARDLARQYRSAVGRGRGVAVPGWAIAPLSALCEWYHRWSGGQLPAVLTRYKSRATWLPLRYSNAKAKAVLGWAPETDFARGLDQTFAWLRRQAA